MRHKRTSRTCLSGGEEREVLKRLSLLLLALVTVSVLHAQIFMEPRMTFSLDVPSLVDTDSVFEIGGTVAGGVRISSLPDAPIGLSLDLHATTMVLNFGESFDINIFRAEAGADFRFHFFPWLAANFRASGGPAVLWSTVERLPYSDNVVTGLGLRGGVGLLFRPGRFMISLGVEYNGIVELEGQFAGSISVGLVPPGTAPTRPADVQAEPANRPGLLESGAGADAQSASGHPSITSVSIPPLFPVMRKYYAEHPIGSVVITNESEAPVRDVLVSVNMPGIIDTPLPSARFETLEPGQREQVELLAIFNESVLSVTESERVPATVTVDFVAGGQTETVSEVVAVEIHDRNTLIWDDDRKVAMFVTARDPALKVWAGNLSAAVTNEGSAAIDSRIQHAIMMHTALAGTGLAYGPDPATPYAQMSVTPFALDYVQFPLQTLTVRTGDCDDISVTYAALMEAAGQPAAFVLTPGHIFVATRLECDPATAASQYLLPEDLIVVDGEVWLPVEVTRIQDDFVNAWSVAGRQWREACDRGQAEIIRVADAWQIYPSVAFPATHVDFTPPEPGPTVAEFGRQLDQFVRREISARETALLDAIGRNPDDYRNRNRLGVLYARYGLHDEADTIFSHLAQDTDSVPALVNLGNLELIRGNAAAAGQWYARAAAIDPHCAAAVLGLARTNYEAENYGLVRQHYQELITLDAALAERYAYLSMQGSSTARASGAAALAGSVEWEE